MVPERARGCTNVRLVVGCRIDFFGSSKISELCIPGTRYIVPGIYISKFSCHRSPVVSPRLFTAMLALNESFDARRYEISASYHLRLVFPLYVRGVPGIKYRARVDFRFSFFFFQVGAVSNSILVRHRPGSTLFVDLFRPAVPFSGRTTWNYGRVVLPPNGSAVRRANQ